MSEFLIGFFTLTGGMFWILAFAWFVGWVGEKLGVSKSS
tara:strand:- start:18 stop:134 length:117 start_codon:yes stop_codon:yes gene_type:complete